MNSEAKIDDGATAGGGVVPETTDRKLARLLVECEADGLRFAREIEIVGNVTMAELLAAMREDERFLNPTVHEGELVLVEDDDRHVLLAYYRLREDDYPVGELAEVQAFYDDGTEETVPLE